MSVIETVKQTLKEKKIAEINMNEKNALNNALNIVKKMKKIEQYKDADKMIDMMMKIDNVKKIYIIINIVMSSA